MALADDSTLQISLARSRIREGRTVDAAVEEAVPANVLVASLFARFRSREEHTLATSFVGDAPKFGGHVEHPAKSPPNDRRRVAGHERHVEQGLLRVAFSQV
jgi:6-phosphogluconate dehydrogenase